jgi:hypothetical protein
MANQSSVPAVKGALFTMLTTALPTTMVTYAMSVRNFEESRESAWLGVARFGEEAVAGFRPGALPHNEAYTVPVYVMATTEGDDPQATEARAFELAALFEDAVRQNGSLGLGNVQWANLTGKEPNLHPHGDVGWLAILEMTVSVQVRI